MLYLLVYYDLRIARLLGLGDVEVVGVLNWFAKVNSCSNSLLLGFRVWAWFLPWRQLGGLMSLNMMYLLLLLSSLLVKLVCPSGLTLSCWNLGLSKADRGDAWNSYFALNLLLVSKKGINGRWANKLLGLLLVMRSGRKTIPILAVLLGVLAVNYCNPRTLLDEWPLVAGCQVVAVIRIGIAVKCFPIWCYPLLWRHFDNRLSVHGIICKHCIGLRKVLGFREGGSSGGGVVGAWFVWLGLTSFLFLPL